MEFPEDRKYTNEHEWAALEGQNRVRVGITDYAQDALGDVVYVDLPEEGTAVNAGQPFGEVESTKSVSDIFSPVTGRVIDRNAALSETPELVNRDPYGDGWMVLVETDGPAQLDALMDADGYRRVVEASSEG
jgi:glycine cleavage system H protein